jgi:hypothetical protein
MLYPVLVYISGYTTHTHTSTEELVKEMVKVIQKVNPFEPCLGRQFLSFPNIPKSPLKNLNVTALHKWLSANKK